MNNQNNFYRNPLFSKTEQPNNFTSNTSTSANPFSNQTGTTHNPFSANTNVFSTQQSGNPFSTQSQFTTSSTSSFGNPSNNLFSNNPFSTQTSLSNQPSNLVKQTSFPSQTSLSNQTPFPPQPSNLVKQPSFPSQTSFGQGATGSLFGNASVFNLGSNNNMLSNNTNNMIGNNLMNTSNLNQPTTSTSYMNNSSIKTGLFNQTSSLYSNVMSKNGTKDTRFEPVRMKDDKGIGMLEYNHINAMKEYKDKSVDELRYEDYNWGRRMSSQPTPLWTPQAGNQSSSIAGNQQNNLLGSQGTNILASQPSSLFEQQGSLFGQSSTSTQNKNTPSTLTGTSNPVSTLSGTSLFTNQPSTHQTTTQQNSTQLGSLFGNQQGGDQQGNLFGTQLNTQQNGTQQASLFGTQPSSQKGSLFGTQQGSLFGNQQSNNTLSNQIGTNTNTDTSMVNNTIFSQPSTTSYIPSGWGMTPSNTLQNTLFSRQTTTRDLSDPYGTKGVIFHAKDREPSVYSKYLTNSVQKHNSVQVEVLEFRDPLEEEQDDLYCIPCFDDLKKMSNIRKKVDNLIINFPSKGQIQYLDLIEIKYITSDNINKKVLFLKDNVLISDPPGHGLNVHARVQIERVYPCCRSENKLIVGRVDKYPMKGIQDRFVYTLRHDKDKKFISYDYNTGRYVYEVNHF